MKLYVLVAIVLGLLAVSETVAPRLGREKIMSFLSYTFNLTYS